MKYKVVRVTGANSISLVEELEKKVTHLMENGWKPAGGVAAVIEEKICGNMTCLMQAMVSEDG